MPKSHTGRVRRTEKQWIEILHRFGSSGLGARQFCRRDHLTLSSLKRWQRRLGRVRSAKFVEIVPAPSTDAASASWSLEVALPNGASLQFRG